MSDETREEFIARIRRENLDGLRRGVALGWWDDVDEERCEPIKYLRFTLADGPTMAHVMHKAGAFTSIGEARRNGWDRPIEKGKWTVGKRRKTIVVE